MRPIRVRLLGVLACAIVWGGCGGTDSSSGGAKPEDVPPRGEDEMKKQMESLQKKGSHAPGVPRNHTTTKKP